MLDPRLHQQAINHDFNGVIFSFVEINGDLVVQTDQFAVNACPRVAMLDQRFHFLLELALAPADDRCHHHDPVFRAQRHDALDNLVGRLPTDSPPALRAMRHADRSEKQAKVVVNFGDGSDGRARTAACGFLLDRDGRAKSINCIHIRAFHLV
jgi:hypothetical protein